MSVAFDQGRKCANLNSTECCFKAIPPTHTCTGEWHYLWQTFVKLITLHSPFQKTEHKSLSTERTFGACKPFTSCVLCSSSGRSPLIWPFPLFGILWNRTSDMLLITLDEIFIILAAALQWREYGLDVSNTEILQAPTTPSIQLKIQYKIYMYSCSNNISWNRNIFPTRLVGTWIYLAAVSCFFRWGYNKIRTTVLDQTQRWPSSIFSSPSCHTCLWGFWWHANATSLSCSPGSDIWCCLCL